MASAKDNQWLFTKEQLTNTPSRKHYDEDKELSYRQQAASLVQDMGQRLPVNQLTINTAIVYMHRFYMYHSFYDFSRHAMAQAALFLAAKVEEQPKKLEHVLKIGHACLHADKTHFDTHSDSYLKQAQELVQNELTLLQTLGFDISVDHPHTHVVKCAQLVKASKDLSQMAYYMATNSLHLTRFCLFYKPTVVAAMCIHLSCKWSNYEIPLSSDGKPYWSYMDPTITETMLNSIVKEFLEILERCPTRLRKLKNYRPSSETKADGKEKMIKPPSHQPSTSQTVPHPPSTSGPSSSAAQKEKRPMSLEEYKRTHPKQHQQQQQQQQKHISSTSASTSAHQKPSQQYFQGQSKHHDGRQHPVKPHPLKPDHRQEAIRNNPSMQNPNHTKPHVPRSNTTEPQKHKEQRNMMAPGHPQHPHHHQGQPNKLKAAHAGSDIDAVTKDLEGKIQSEKIHHQTKVSLSHYHQRSATHPSSVQVNAQPNKPISQDAARRHHSDKAHETSANQSRPTAKDPSSKQYSKKALGEMYQRNPEKVRNYLKHKANIGQLGDDEKIFHEKLQAAEEERRKRKALEKQQKAKQAEAPLNQVASPGGSLTLRIKLTPNTNETNSNTSVAKIVGSSSGSGSEASPARSRKRGHAPEHFERSAAKHSKRSEDYHKHHRSSGNGSSSGSSSHKHKKHHKHSRSKNPEHIDEAVFQKSLSAAISKVKQQVPTVTLKKAANGGDGTYFAASQKPDFDPTAPVSSTMPEQIFEEDVDSGAFVGSSQMASHESNQSTPEPGEIKGDSPNVVQHWSSNTNTPGLFSPQSDADQKLQRSGSGFGYHSNNENDFSSPPPPLMRKPVQ